MKTRGQRQGGWAATFIIVGAVLVLGLLGSIYYLKTQSSSDDNIAVETPETTMDQSDNTQKNKSSSDSDNSKQDSADSDSNTSDNSPQSTDVGSSSDVDADSGDDTADVELPETGPADMLAHAVAVSLLTGAVVAYVRSR